MIEIQSCEFCHCCSSSGNVSYLATDDIRLGRHDDNYDQTGAQEGIVLETFLLFFSSKNTTDIPLS